MFSALQTKLLIVVVGLLASIASYFAYEKHEKQVEQNKVNALHQNLRPDEKKALDGTSPWGKDVNKQALK